MSEVVTPLLEWLNAHPHLAGLATFVISAGESVAIIGTIVPGSIMMTGIGALAGAGVIPLWPTIIWAILGAIVGDGISYWIGYYFRDRLPLIWPFRTNPSLLATGERFVHKYGGMSVFIGRFVGPVRALVPLVAGMLGMRPLAFTLANVASAIGWAPAYMLPGILLGAASLELPPDIALHVILVLFLIFLFILLCLWLVYKILQLIHAQTTQLQNWIWRGLKKSRLFSPATVLLRHHHPDKTHGQFSLALLFIVTVFFLAILIICVKLKGAANIGINDALYHLFRGLSVRSEKLNHIMINLTLLGQKQVILPVIFVVFVWLIVFRRFRTAFHAAALGILAAGSVFVLKHLIQSPRPWGILSSGETFSMPSGHTTLATTFFFGLAFLVAKSYRKSVRWPFYLSAITIALIVGLSRLYLGAHWFTDILAAWLLSVAVLTIVIISYQRKKEKPVHPLAVLCLSLLTLTITFSYYYHRHFNELKLGYSQLDWPTYPVDEAMWWQKDNALSSYRVSLFGFPSQKINVEWAGDIETIQNTLLTEGWKKPPARDWVSTLHRIADISSTEYLPLIAPQYLDKRPELTLIRKFDDKTNLVIRLWHSHRILMPSNQILWIGTVSIVPRSYSWIYKKNVNDIAISSSHVFGVNLSKDKWEWKMLTISVSQKRQMQLNILLIKPRKD